jgi:hypothetical protein
MLWPLGTLGVPRARVVLRTLALRPAQGALQRPIVASFEPGEADATFQPLGPGGAAEPAGASPEAPRSG